MVAAQYLEPHVPQAHPGAERRTRVKSERGNEPHAGASGGVPAGRLDISVEPIVGSLRLGPRGRARQWRRLPLRAGTPSQRRRHRQQTHDSGNIPLQSTMRRSLPQTERPFCASDQSVLRSDPQVGKSHLAATAAFRRTRCNEPTKVRAPMSPGSLQRWPFADRRR